MTIANSSDRINPSDDLRGSSLVVPGVTPSEDPRVERTANYDRYSCVETFRKQIVERPLLEQGVAPGEQKGVPVTPFHRLQQNFPLVDADPDRPNDPAPAQLLKRTVATFTKGAHDPEMRLCAMLLCTDVVYVENIDPSQAESLQTILERSDDPLVRVVKHAIERHWRPGYVARGLLGLRAQQPPDFRRQHP